MIHINYFLFKYSYTLLFDKKIIYITDCGKRYRQFITSECVSQKIIIIIKTLNPGKTNSITTFYENEKQNISILIAGKINCISM